MGKTQKFTIRENTDFNSLEISFTGIPDQQTRNKLKAYGFRWNPKKSVWYGYADRETLETDYIKRLKTYYKRYGDKITTHGYWANR